MQTKYPERIICLTEETTETLYLLGAEDKIVGISSFTKRPPEAKKSKPSVSNFTQTNFNKIEKLNPDLIFSFSDVQAEITKELAKRGFQVLVFNQRSISEILQNILIIGSIIGKSKEAENLVNSYEQRIDKVKKRSSKLKYHPKVYFEEWGNPFLTGICWVSELIEIAGGKDIFAERRNAKAAKERVVLSEEIIKRNPDIIVGSWCGKKFRKNEVKKREDWKNISAIKNNKLFEIDSSLILQPGPAALTEGLDELVKVINDF